MYGWWTTVMRNMQERGIQEILISQQSVNCGCQRQIGHPTSEMLKATRLTKQTEILKVRYLYISKSLHREFTIMHQCPNHFNPRKSHIVKWLGYNNTVYVRSLSPGGKISTVTLQLASKGREGMFAYIIDNYQVRCQILFSNPFCERYFKFIKGLGVMNDDMY